jgi:hypothetical protein
MSILETDFENSWEKKALAGEDFFSLFAIDELIDI